MKQLIILILLANSFIPKHLNAQSENKRFHLGIELDALPFVTGGYFGAMTIGTQKLRGRLLYTKVNMPSFITPSQFNYHRVHSTAVLVDYFFKDMSQNGFWLGLGIVRWNSSIREKSSDITKEFDTYLINGSLGYLYPIWKRFYISPWAGMSIPLNASAPVKIGNSIYQRPFFNPEASIKIGFKIL